MAKYQSEFTGQEIDERLSQVPNKISAEDLKTINGESLVGDGNIEVQTPIEDLDEIRENAAAGGTALQPEDLSPYRTGAEQDFIDDILAGRIVGKYTKPTGGIPKTDLASAVQTSLDKADSAYQKPSLGIPASDLASGVIPSVPTISTDIEADKTSNTKTASPKAVYDALQGTGVPVGTNFAGFFDTASELPTATEPSFAMVGTNLESLSCYIWNDATSGWVQLGTNTYDFTGKYVTITQNTQTGGYDIAVGGGTPVNIAKQSGLAEKISKVDIFVSDAEITQDSPIFTVEDDKYIDNHGDLTNNTAPAYHYKTYWFTATSNMSIYVQSFSSAAYFTLANFNGSIGSANFIARRRAADNNLPTENNPLAVTSGQTIAITARDTFSFVLSKSPASFTNELIPSIVLNKTQVEQVLAKAGKSFVKYEQIASTESSAEQISIYIPSFNGYVKYAVVHTINASRYADNWRIGIPYACDAERNELYPLSPGGEWECALHLADRDDFSGGYAHGDETGTSLLIFVDGKIYNYTELADGMQFEEIKVVTTSILYDPADHTTAIANHGCERIFTKDVIKVSQSIKWLANESLNICYLAMMPPIKEIDGTTITNKLYTDVSFAAVDTPTSGKVSVNDAKKAVVYGEDSNISFEMAIGRYPDNYIGGKNFFVSDNNGQNYNKMYFRISTEGSVSAGDLWLSETFYKIELG